MAEKFYIGNDILTSLLTGELERQSCVKNYKIKEFKMREYKGFLVDDNLKIYNQRTGLELTPYKGSDGYMQVAKREANMKTTHIRVHTLYANLFIPNPNNYTYINHIDSDKTNNSLDNLEWCSNSYNVKHGWESGNRTHRNRTKISVFLGNELVGKYSSIRECGSSLKLDRHKIARILKGELPPNYWKYTFIYN